MIKLEPQHKLFADYYMDCWVGVEAAELAGYKGDYRTLGVQAHRLLKNAKILAYIEDTLATRVMSANEVLARLTDIARATADDFIDESTGGLDLVKAKKRKKLHLVSKVKDKHFINAKDDTEVHEVEIELYSALDALKTLAKYHQLINTQTLKFEDWRSLAIEQIRAGRIQYDALVDGFDKSLADELFQQAGVPIAR